MTKRYVLPFPVLPDISDAEVKEAAAIFRSNPEQYRESRSRAGLTLERVYLQKTPMGDFVIAYSEGEKDYPDVIASYFDGSLEINNRFVEFVKRVHGFDPAEAAKYPPPETIGEWWDPNVTTRKAGLAFTAPVIAGQEEHGRSFLREAMVIRRDEFTASRRALNVNGEVVTLLQTPMGPVVAAYLEGADPVEGNRLFAASQTPFDRWFKDECRKLFPPYIDFDQPLPPIEQFFDSTELLTTA